MSEKILLIDDDRVNNNVMKAGLEKHGYRVVVAEDGEAGLRMVQSDSPDLIVLDIEMPNMNGYNFIHELRKMELFKNTPVIVLTSHDKLQPIFELKGVEDYMLKPVRFDLLYEKIKQVLNQEDQQEQESV